MHPDGSTFIDRLEDTQPIRAIGTMEVETETELKKADIQISNETNPLSKMDIR